MKTPPARTRATPRNTQATMAAEAGAQQAALRSATPLRGVATHAEADDAGGSPNQTMRALLRLRELIVGGELKAGERIAELSMVQRLGVSRTPIRSALVRLQEEGLLEAVPSGGFMVRAFSEDDLRDAIELRGTLEGLAARFAAERGVPASLLAQMRDCLAQIDALLAPHSLSEQAFAGYTEHNARFHTLLAQMSGSSLLVRQIERASTLPFASPNAFVMAASTGARARDHLVVAQAQHRAAVEAILAGQGARAEALMQEHARSALRNLAEVLVNQPALQRVQGAPMIRPRARLR
jgi:GntR family transcriptional regulator of vanillate catabolism